MKNAKALSNIIAMSGYSIRSALSSTLICLPAVLFYHGAVEDLYSFIRPCNTVADKHHSAHGSFDSKAYGSQHYSTLLPNFPNPLSSSKIRQLPPSRRTELFESSVPNVHSNYDDARTTIPGTSTRKLDGHRVCFCR